MDDSEVLYEARRAALAAWRDWRDANTMWQMRGLGPSQVATRTLQEEEGLASMVRAYEARLDEALVLLGDATAEEIDP